MKARWVDTSKWLKDAFPYRLCGSCAIRTTAGGWIGAKGCEDRERGRAEVMAGECEG